MKLFSTFFVILSTLFTSAPSLAQSPAHQAKLVEFSNHNYVQEISPGSNNYGVYNQQGQLISQPFFLSPQKNTELTQNYVLIGGKTIFLFSEFHTGPFGINSKSSIVMIDQEGQKYSHSLKTSLQLTSVVAVDEKTIVFGSNNKKIYEVQAEKNFLKIKNEYLIGDYDTPVVDLFKTAGGKILAIKRLFQYQYGLVQLSTSMAQEASVNFNELISSRPNITDLKMHYLHNQSFVMNHKNNLGQTIWFNGDLRDYKVLNTTAPTRYFPVRVLNEKQVLFMSRDMNIHAIDENGILNSTPSHLAAMQMNYKNQNSSWSDNVQINNPGCLAIYKDWSGVDWIRSSAQVTFGAAVGVLIYVNPIFSLPVLFSIATSQPNKDEIPELREKEHLILAAKTVAGSYLASPLPEHQMIYNLISPWRTDIKNAAEVQALIRKANEQGRLCLSGSQHRPLLLPEIVQKIIFNELLESN